MNVSVPSVSKLGSDVAKGASSEIDEIKKRLEIIEKNSDKILNTMENIGEKIAEALYNFAKTRIQAMIFIIMFF